MIGISTFDVPIKWHLPSTLPTIPLPLLLYRLHFWAFCVILEFKMAAKKAGKFETNQNNHFYYTWSMEIAEAVLYNDDSLCVRYQDGSFLQLTPCASSFRFYESRSSSSYFQRHYFQQITRFTISSLRGKVASAVKWRNQYACRPYLCKELIEKELINVSKVYNIYNLSMLLALVCWQYDYLSLYIQKVIHNTFLKACLFRCLFIYLIINLFAYLANHSFICLFRYRYIF